MGISNTIPPSRLIQPGVCTSSTRPTSPFEGQVIYETDTDRTLVWNGSAWVDSASGISNPSTVNIASNNLNGMVVNTTGIVQKPYVPAFTTYCGYVDGHAAITGGVLTTTAVPLNNGGHFKTSGAGAYQNFVAPIAGFYHFDFHWTIISGTAGNYYGAYFQVDGTTVDSGYINYFKHAGGNDDAAAAISTNFYLTANQTVRVAISNQNSARFQFARFSGFMIG